MWLRDTDGRPRWQSILLPAALLLGLLTGVSMAEEAPLGMEALEQEAIAQLEKQLVEVHAMIQSFERLADDSLARARATSSFDLRTRHQQQHLELRQAVSEMKAVEAEIRSALGELAADGNLEDNNVP